MFRTIMGFFGGAMSDSSKENQELCQEKNNEVSHQTKDKSTEAESPIMAAGEQGAVLRDRVHHLEQELKERIEESEGYKNRLQFVEKELQLLKTMAISHSATTVSTGVGDNDVRSRKNSTEKEPLQSDSSDVTKLSNENTELREALSKTSELLKDKTDLCDNQEKQNLALNNQISSLKEVVAITKDLLNIRNMEVQHLQSDVESMEGKIADERLRHNTMIVKMDEAVKLNSDLKKEYENQLRIFQELRSKYEEKVAYLMKENKKLEGQIFMTKAESSSLSDSLESANTDTPN